ncbi:MAG TPA: hypothetical protein VGR48_09045, partial [Terriglobales bacterium]|nr:hypothetical protein [Terriglobales bacterium]
SIESSLRAVTGIALPVLIPADGVAEGIVIDPKGSMKDSLSGVRRLHKKELKASRVAEKLTAEEWRELRGVTSLKIALAKDDPLATHAALSLLGRNPENFGDTMGGDNLLEYGRIIATAPLTNALRRAQLVYWVTRKTWHLGLGIFCPDFKTGVAVHLLLTDAFRVCPRCHKTFEVEHPGQMCCSIQCREAHRIARWRARKKRGEKQ